jgi:hypothetical protein
MWPLVASTTPRMFEAFYCVTRIEREASVMLLQPAAGCSSAGDRF